MRTTHWEYSSNHQFRDNEVTDWTDLNDWCLTPPDTDLDVKDKMNSDLQLRDIKMKQLMLEPSHFLANTQKYMACQVRIKVSQTINETIVFSDGSPASKMYSANDNVDNAPNRCAGEKFTIDWCVDKASFFIGDATGMSSMKCSIWYDQGGNGNDLIQYSSVDPPINVEGTKQG